MSSHTQYIKNVINHEVTSHGNSDMQEVLGSNVDFYTVDTSKRANSTDTMTLASVSILTPYAGDGYGMLCAPRTGQKVAVLPIMGNDSSHSSLILGRVFQENERVPGYSVGDFIIHHETNSALRFRFTQPTVEPDGTLQGDVVKLAEYTKIKGTADARSFGVSIDDESGLPPLNFGDSVSVILTDGVQSDHPSESGEGEDARLSWVTRVQGEKGDYYVNISTQNLSHGIDVPDYMAFEINQLKAYRILPEKGTVELQHYIGSGLFIEEYGDYEYIYDENGEKKLVRYNVNAVDGELVVEGEEGNEKQVSKHRSKGLMELVDYDRSGLLVREKEKQYRANAKEVILQLQKSSPTNDISLILSRYQLPGAQVILEDITQDERDVATRAIVRLNTSGIISDESAQPDGQLPVLKFQEESSLSHDCLSDETLELQGSNLTVEDFLKVYDEDKKGWKFVSNLDAVKEHKEFDTAFEEAAASGERKQEGEGDYKLEYKKKIVPASIRRDILRKIEDGNDKNKSSLLNNASEVITDENKEFIGNQGYSYKTDNEEAKNKEDGYLCIPKGKLELKHYTQSGLNIRETDPDADFHSMHASFSLVSWDVAQYGANHTYAEQRDSADMLFGPMLIPDARFVMENAKYEGSLGSDSTGFLDSLDEGMASIPSAIFAHTQFPQPQLKEEDYGDRRTMSTYGETASRVGIEHFSSHIQSTSSGLVTENGLNKERIGSRLIFNDYVIHASPDDVSGSPLISAAKWLNERGNRHDLLAPKGSVELQHYTSSGLSIYDKRLHYLNKKHGGHAMAMELTMSSLDFVNMEDGKPVEVNKRFDGKFFCEMLSNELVDKGEYTYNLTDKMYDEGGSVRGKKAEEAHGKRAAFTGFMHNTVVTTDEQFPAMAYLRDYIIPVEEESDSLDSVIQPAHIYKSGMVQGEERKLLMPKGEGGFLFWNKSQLKFYDAEKSNDKGIDPDDTSRGKKQLPTTLLSLNAWNNQNIDGGDCEAQPYKDESVILKMENIANVSAYNGKDATRVQLHAISSKIKTEDYGSTLLFEDYTQDGGGDDEKDSQHYYDAGGGAGGSGIGMSNSIVSYDAAGGVNVEVPSSINGEPVTNIGAEAFADKGLESLTLPEGIETIGKGAVKNNHLTDINLPDSTKVVQAEAFKNNQLTEVNLPNNATALGSDAFANNNITDVGIASGTVDIADGIFQDNQISNLTNLPTSVERIGVGAFKNNTISNLELPENTIEIDSQAFMSNDIASVELPPLLERIGQEAFKDNALSAIEIPNAVTEIGKKAFGGVPEADITLGSGYSSYFVNDGGSVLGHIGKPSASFTLPEVVNGVAVSSVDSDAFVNEDIINVSIPSAIEIIGNGAFEGNQITTLNVSYGLKEIGKYAFGNNLLTSVSLPNSLEVVAEGAFSGNNITEVIMPADVSIGINDAMGDNGEDFREFYGDSDLAAGTYRHVAGSWTLV